MRSYGDAVIKRLCLATAAVALAAPTAGPALAANVECGDVITTSVTLDADLTGCAAGGLVVGASDITIDLGGYAVEGKSDAYGHSVGVGIDNRAGYDRVRIVNGTVTRFAVGVRLHGARRNHLGHLQVSGEDGVVASASDRNEIVDSWVYGSGRYMRIGDGIVLKDGSDGNRLLRDGIGGEGTPLVIEGSRRNVVSDIGAGGYSGTVRLANAPGTTIRSSRISAGWNALDVYESDHALIIGNQLRERVTVYGSDRVRIVGNSIAMLRLVSGARNRISRNRVGFSHWDDRGILVEAAATATRVEYNVATNGFPSGIGIDVQAAGTLIRANVASLNGYLGIQAVSGAIDGGRNVAVGNGDPRQCTGVVCASAWGNPDDRGDPDDDRRSPDDRR